MAKGEGGAKKLERERERGGGKKPRKGGNEREGWRKKGDGEGAGEENARDWRLEPF